MTTALQTLIRRKETLENQGKTNKTKKISPTEPEATIQMSKNNMMIPSYKPSVFVADKRIIVSIKVHSSNEQIVLSHLIESAQKNTQKSIKELLLDAGYFCESVINLTTEKEIELFCPKHNYTLKDKYLKIDFEYNKDLDIYICPNKKELTLKESGYDKTQNKKYNRYRASIEDCQKCPLIEKCTKNKKGKQITRYNIDEAKDMLIEKMKTESAKATYKLRSGMVEPIFSEIKEIQGLKRFTRRGNEGAALEFSLHAMCHNIRHLIIERGRAP